MRALSFSHHNGQVRGISQGSTVGCNQPARPC